MDFKLHLVRFLPVLRSRMYFPSNQNNRLVRTVHLKTLSWYDEGLLVSVWTRMKTVVTTEQQESQRICGVWADRRCRGKRWREGGGPWVEHEEDVSQSYFWPLHVQYEATYCQWIVTPASRVLVSTRALKSTFKCLEAILLSKVEQEMVHPCESCDVTSHPYPCREREREGEGD